MRRAVKRAVKHAARPAAKSAGQLIDGARAPSQKPRVDYTLRREEYLRAAARIFLEKGPSATMQDVADGAGAPKPVFYRIFPSRQALIEAFFEHVHDAIIRTQSGDWEGYGWALKVLYLEAEQSPEVFLAALKTFRSDPAFDPCRNRLQMTIQAKAMGFFVPAPGAPAGAQERAVRATHTLSTLSFDTLVAWLENRDRLSNEQRFKWWGRIIREWRKASREAFELDPPVADDGAKADRPGARR
jgi:AcrR family transcriptional regulator